MAIGNGHSGRFQSVDRRCLLDPQVALQDAKVWLKFQASRQVAVGDMEDEYVQLFLAGLLGAMQHKLKQEILRQDVGLVGLKAAAGSSGDFTSAALASSSKSGIGKSIDCEDPAKIRKLQNLPRVDMKNSNLPRLIRGKRPFVRRDSPMFTMT
jgi:hypothetical protein